MNRRSFLGAVSSVLAASTPAARAAEGPVRVVVGFPPGGSVDGVARVAADVLAPGWGRQIIVENRPGAAGRLAVDFVRNAAPDGGTFLVCPQGPMTLFPHVFKNLGYDPARDFTPIARLGVSDLALSVGPMVPVGSLAGLREWLATAGDRAAFGSPGAGTIVHFTGVAVSQLLGVKMTHVPYAGSAKSMVDLAGGTIAMVFSPVTEALELHRAGRIRMLVTTGRTRSEFVPDVPTMQELGYDIDVQGWNALYGPARLPAKIADPVRAVMDKGFAAPDTRKRLALLGIIPAPLDAEGLEALRRKESAMWEKIVSSSGFKPEA